MENEKRIVILILEKKENCIKIYKDCKVCNYFLHAFVCTIAIFCTKNRDMYYA